MKRLYVLPSAYALDLLAGDPEWFPHPVRLIGLAIVRGEKLLRTPGDTPAKELLTGVALSASIVLGAYALTQAILRIAYRRGELVGTTTEITLGWTCLATRNLQQEAQAVSDALLRENLMTARKQLARIVGRDTADLDSSEISRALIETLAESASDGIMAPLFFMALGGVPLAMAYKAVNTLDSMIGHRATRYLYFGKAAARLDDVANYLPARTTALATVVASSLSQHADTRAAFSVWRRDANKHKSPNAGQPEAAMAGALHVRLGGDNYYDGELIVAPRMGEEFAAASPVVATEAIRLTMRVALIGLAAATLLAAFSSRRAS
jgi:adenosylcobinamide-phosphate synthase